MSNFKVKVGVGVAVIVALLTVAVYWVIVPPLHERAVSQVRAAVKRADRLVQRSQRLHAFELLSLARSIAAHPLFQEPFRIAGEEQEEAKRKRFVRAAAFDAVNELDKQLRAQNRKPHFFALVGADRRIMARDLDPNANYGDVVPYGLVARALAGRAGSDIILRNNRMMRAAAAPVHYQGKVAGVVLIAYDFTLAEARDEESQFGAHVAYFMKGAIRASSFTLPDGSEDAEMVAALNARLLSSGGAAERAVTEGKATPPFEITLDGGATYLLVAGPLMTLSVEADSVAVIGAESSRKKAAVAGGQLHAGYIVAASMSAAVAPVRQVRWYLLGFGILFLLVGLGTVVAVARHYVAAEDELELGVNEIINGNLDYTFPPSQEFEGLANALNVMLARLLGRPEPGEEDEEEASGGGDVVHIDASAAGGDDDLARQLAAEPEDAYYQRIFREYQEARARIGLPPGTLTAESLAQKLRANEAMLKAKHNCQMVRFVVTSAGGQVSFRPVLIR